MFIDYAGRSDIGRKKDKNEDSFGIFDEHTPGTTLLLKGLLIAVADGLGGHTSGDIASKLAVSMVRDVLKDPPPPDEDRGSEREDQYYLDALKKAVLRANKSIYQTNLDLIKGKRPMATTLCAVLIRAKMAYIVNVGDSRAYLFRKGRIIFKTEDHSWVDEQVKLGLMTQEDADKDKRRNLVTRSIGTHEELEIDTYVRTLEPDDIILVCTDGLTNMVPDAEIEILLNSPLLAKQKVDRLIDLANENGGKDNITSVIAWIDPPPRILRRLKITSWFLSHTSTLCFFFWVGFASLISFSLGFLMCLLCL